MGRKPRQNWVDRGDAPEPTMRRVLAHFLGYPPEEGGALVDEGVLAICGMVDADASEVLVAGYVGSLEDRVGRPRSPGAERRLLAIALWHIAKAARVRDAAIRAIVDAQRPAAPGTATPLAEWLVERLLTPEEKALHAAALARLGAEPGAAR